jgi:hypothetical protein
MTEQKPPGRVRVIPDRNRPRPEGFKKLPSLSARITDVVDADREQRPGGLIQGLGTRSKVTRAKRTKKPASMLPAAPLNLQEQFLQRINTPLTSGGMPTLAQRVAVEGVAAQLQRKKKKPKAPAAVSAKDKA